MQSNAEVNLDDMSLHLVEDLRNDSAVSKLKVENGVSSNSCCQKYMELRATCNNVCERDVTILLLRKEIESALESLKQVQLEMDKLQNEKEEIRMSEKQNNETLEFLVSQILNLQEAMHKFEEKSAFKIEVSNKKIERFGQTIQEAAIQWCQRKEVLFFFAFSVSYLYFHLQLL